MLADWSEPTQPEIATVLAGLPGVLATLNYDELFEKATGSNAVTWQHTHKVVEVLRGEPGNRRAQFLLQNVICAHGQPLPVRFPLSASIVKLSR